MSDLYVKRDCLKYIKGLLLENNKLQFDELKLLLLVSKIHNLEKLLEPSVDELIVKALDTYNDVSNISTIELIALLKLCGRECQVTPRGKCPKGHFSEMYPEASYISLNDEIVTIHFDATKQYTIQEFLNLYPDVGWEINWIDDYIVNKIKIKHDYPFEFDPKHGRLLDYYLDFGKYILTV